MEHHQSIPTVLSFTRHQLFVSGRAKWSRNKVGRIARRDAQLKYHPTRQTTNAEETPKNASSKTICDYDEIVATCSQKYVSCHLVLKCHEVS